MKKLAIILNVITFVIWGLVFLLILRNFFGNESAIEKNLLGGSNQGNRFSLIIAYIIADIIVSVQKSTRSMNMLAEIVKKNKLNAQLISKCIVYDYNEYKLTKLMEEYKEKMQLESEVEQIKQKIDLWKEMFSGDDTKSKKKNAVLNDQQKEIEILLKELDRKNRIEARKNMEIEERLNMGAGFKPKFIFNFYQKIMSMKNDFMFDDILTLYNFILIRNEKLIKNTYIDMRKFLCNNFDSIEDNLTIVSDVYKKYAEYASKNPNIKKFNETDIKLPNRIKLDEIED